MLEVIRNGTGKPGSLELRLAPADMAADVGAVPDATGRRRRLHRHVRGQGRATDRHGECARRNTAKKLLFHGCPRVPNDLLIYIALRGLLNAMVWKLQSCSKSENHKISCYFNDLPQLGGVS